ncbi:MAG: hypothetical protein MUF02_00440 [Acidobacteria bacterium]|jgi:hypothetical protein|nr:hypothetical protein [Acidobacteriota bacterium]
MPYPKYRLLDKKKLKTQSIKERRSLVHLEDFPKPCPPGAGFRAFIDSMPPYLAAKELRELTALLGEARQKGKPIIWGMGAHAIKLGLGPLLIDLMQRGWISAIATNGAMMIHDFELALAGHTSEDVAENLLGGTYGNTEETGLFLNLALKDGLAQGMGAGEAVGHYLIQARLPHLDGSVLYNAYRLNIPVTIHPAIGTDFIHYHPMFSGEVTGALAERDFQLLAAIVSELSGGGVFLNIGSTVIVPEVFLKAVAYCAAQGAVLENFHTAVFDFNRHYRPLENVCRRPTSRGGRGFYFIGPHEVMIPLLAAMILNRQA